MLPGRIRKSRSLSVIISRPERIFRVVCVFLLWDACVEKHPHKGEASSGANDVLTQVQDKSLSEMMMRRVAGYWYRHTRRTEITEVSQLLFLPAFPLTELQSGQLMLTWIACQLHLPLGWSLPPFRLLIAGLCLCGCWRTIGDSRLWIPVKMRLENLWTIYGVMWKNQTG